MQGKSEKVREKPEKVRENSDSTWGQKYLRYIYIQNEVKIQLI